MALGTELIAGLTSAFEALVFFHFSTFSGLCRIGASRGFLNRQTLFLQKSGDK